MPALLLAVKVLIGTTSSLLPLHPWGEPASKDTTLTVLRNTAYDCGYSRRLKVARWASYAYVNMGSPRTPRKGRFRPDPRLDSASTAFDSDYRNSGFDRGHLAPDAALKVFGLQSQQETYYFSNIVPQDPKINRGIWADIEQAIRDWAGGRDTIWAVVGPAWFRHRDTTWLGRSRIAVPHACFAAVCRTRTPGLIGFLVPNSQPAGRPAATAFLVSIDSIERLTGLDLFRLLPDRLEARFESARPETLWRPQP